MNPRDLIIQHLGPAQWKEVLRGWGEQGAIRLLDEKLQLKTHKIYIVQGAHGQFDFTALPFGSYGYYAANGREALRLTRTNKEIEQVLAANWEHLSTVPPVLLAGLILPFYDGGIKATHLPLANEAALRALCSSPQRTMNESAFADAQSKMRDSSVTVRDQNVILRAITLMGWMHDKQNLGIERVTIQKSGRVELAAREVLAKRIFDTTPSIDY